MVDKPNKKKAASPISSGIEKITGGYKAVVTPKDATGMQGVGITGTERNVAKEIEAFKLGYSADYIASRGGLNSQGYFNDVALSGQLTAAEQKSVTLSDGTVNTGAMAGILQKKAYDEAIARGEDPQSIINKLKNQWGDLYDSTVVTGSAGGTTNGITGGATGGIVGGVNPTGKTLAKDAFISTFKLIVGDSEGSKSYVGELYDYVSKYYKSGFTVPEALNLSLRDAKSAGVMPAFTDRFKAVFALEELKRQGKIVDVPTISEYVKSEQALGEVLNRAGLGDLATETTLSNIFSTGKSVAETTSIINDVFLAIDNAPTAWKANVAKVIPFADRTSLARAVLLGAEGAQALQKTVAKAGVLTAAEQQGLTLSSAQQSELVASGESFGTALGKFAQTRGVLDTAQKLKSMEMGIAPKDAYTQEQAMAATFNQSYDELQNLAKLSEREQARFAARPGLMGSKSLASQNRISY
jgi:hypothetical protein